jgi:hypothetical protein
MSQSCVPYLVFDATSFEVEISRHSLHESDKTPECVDLILHDVQDWSQQIGHALRSNVI